MPDVHSLGPLLGRCRAGDPEAFNILLGKLRPYVRVLVRTRLGPEFGRRLDDSDLAQEALLRMHQGFQRFAGESVPQLLAWVGEIARNVLAETGRHHNAARRDLAREVPIAKLVAGLLREGSTPSARLDRAAEAVWLAEALERLPVIQREVLQWRFFDQLPFAEISRRTGKSIGAVRVVCFRALAQLRRDRESAP